MVDQRQHPLQQLRVRAVARQNSVRLLADALSSSLTIMSLINPFTLAKGVVTVADCRVHGQR